jgi:hypothetical protein
LAAPDKDPCAAHDVVPGKLPALPRQFWRCAMVDVHVFKPDQAFSSRLPATGNRFVNATIIVD